MFTRPKGVRGCGNEELYPALGTNGLSASKGIVDFVGRMTAGTLKPNHGSLTGFSIVEPYRFYRGAVRPSRTAQKTKAEQPGNALAFVCPNGRA